MKWLRLYTQGQSQLEVAIEQHIVLVSVRQVVVAAGAANPGLWGDANAIYSVCAAVLARHGTSEKGLGLSVFAYFKSPKWLGKRVIITSPVLPLQAALEVHT